MKIGRKSISALSTVLFAGMRPTACRHAPMGLGILIDNRHGKSHSFDPVDISSPQYKASAISFANDLCQIIMPALVP
jgi:hypothetical protein